MKAKLFLLPAVFSALLPFSTYSAVVVTFDDLLRDTGTASNIPNTYQGLVWSNFAAVNAVLSTNVVGVSGEYYGMVSASNVAFNHFGFADEIDSPGTNFNFFSAYLTGVWTSNAFIQVEGFRGGSLVYYLMVTAAATNATLFSFDYLNIDRLYFNFAGGRDAGFPGSGSYAGSFVMDNFMFEFIPEPSPLLLTILGVLTLWRFAKRRAT